MRPTRILSEQQMQMATAAWHEAKGKVASISEIAASIADNTLDMIRAMGGKA